VGVGCGRGTGSRSTVADAFICHWLNCAKVLTHLKPNCANGNRIVCSCEAPPGEAASLDVTRVSTLAEEGPPIAANQDFPACARLRAPRCRLQASGSFQRICRRIQVQSLCKTLGVGGPATQVEGRQLYGTLNDRNSAPVVAPPHGKDGPDVNHLSVTSEHYDRPRRIVCHPERRLAPEEPDTQQISSALDGDPRTIPCRRGYPLPASNAPVPAVHPSPCPRRRNMQDRLASRKPCGNRFGWCHGEVTLLPPQPS
jgi:hypothetical protein